MDLSKKLDYYKKSPTPEKENIPSSLIALKEHYSGEILFDNAPVLKISQSHDCSAYQNKEVSIRLVSKNEFPKPVPRDKCVFFDLETTGLAVGAGTFAFLIGFSFWDGDQLQTEQYFLPDFGREYQLFNRLQEWLNTFDFIVSYNGKSYDMPLLSSRFVLNRIKPEFKQAGHIDLIHMCRRVWKNSQPSCDLVSMEKKLLNVQRTGDIPGAFIPQAYFDFINTGIIHDVIRLIGHNLQDIVSLSLMFDRLHHIEDDPGKLQLDEQAISLLAKTAFQTEYLSYFGLLENSVLSGQNLPHDYQYWKSLALKKSGKWQDANKLWQNLSKIGEYSFFALEESAKYFEHIKKDYHAALEQVTAAYKRLEIQEDLGYQIFDISWNERFARRKKRLQIKSKV